MEEISKEDLAMLEWLKNASNENIENIMKSVDKEYFNE